MGFFKGANAGKMSENGTYLTPGDYVLEIDRAFAKATIAKGDIFFAECKVLETCDATKHPIGSKRSWAQKLANKLVAGGALKGFLFACMGLDVKDPANAEKIAELEPKTEDLLEEVHEKNTLHGSKVRCTVTTREKKETNAAGGHDTYHVYNFSPYKG